MSTSYSHMGRSRKSRRSETASCTAKRGGSAHAVCFAPERPSLRNVNPFIFQGDRNDFQPPPASICMTRTHWSATGVGFAIEELTPHQPLLAR